MTPRMVSQFRALLDNNAGLCLDDEDDQRILIRQFEEYFREEIALVETCLDLDETCLWTNYGIGPDDNAPLDQNIFYLRDSYNIRREG